MNFCIVVASADYIVRCIIQHIEVERYIWEFNTGNLVRIFFLWFLLICIMFTARHRAHFFCNGQMSAEKEQKKTRKMNPSTSDVAFLTRNIKKNAREIMLKSCGHKIVPPRAWWNVEVNTVTFLFKMHSFKKSYKYGGECGWACIWNFYVSIVAMAVLWQVFSLVCISFFEYIRVFCVIHRLRIFKWIKPFPPAT